MVIALVAFLALTAWSQQTNRTTLKELRAAFCLTGYTASGHKCPPLSPGQRALAAELAKQQQARDDANTARVLAGLQKLLDRPATVRVVTVEGPTRTVFVTRTITVCRTPSGKPC